MDKRGYQSDPNASVSVGEKPWYDTIGSTLGPKPYAPRAWAYLQDWVTKEVTVNLGEIKADPVGYSGGFYNSTRLYPTVWDGGLFNPNEQPGTILDSGLFTGQGRAISTTAKFVQVKVYDRYASYPGLLQDIIVEGGTIITESDLDLTTESNFLISSTAPGNANEDSPPGVLLGQVNYTLIQKSVEITDWSMFSDYYWQDDEPIRNGVKAMINSLPTSVHTITVKDDPSAFWTSLGFVHTSKGGSTLLYSPPNAYKPY